MSFNPDFEQQELIAESMRRSASALTDRERLAQLIVGSGFVAAATALLVLAPPHGLRLLPGLLCVTLLAIAARVEFDTPLGFTVATQLAYVPWCSNCRRRWRHPRLCSACSSPSCPRCAGARPGRPGW
jgi:hypothetical protein